MTSVQGYFSVQISLGDRLSNYVLYLHIVLSTGWTVRKQSIFVFVCTSTITVVHLFFSLIEIQCFCYLTEIMTGLNYQDHFLPSVHLASICFQLHSPKPLGLFLMKLNQNVPQMVLFKICSLPWQLKGKT